jgi:ppGpp synthetase/RelA/SpoT-type nucleotidyltranferase
MPGEQRPPDRDWLRAQVAAYKDVYPHYVLFADLLEDALNEAAKKSAPLSIIQTRPKSIVSFAEKAWRKRHKYHDPVNHLTDLCGARVICRTRSEVDALSQFIKENLDVDWPNSLDTADRLKPAEFGYRSVHYIVTLRPDSTEIFGSKFSRRTIKKKLEDLKGKTAEIQVRTVVEHAYADFAHDLTYKGAFELPASWERELASVAAALEEADQTFSRIEDRLSLYASNYGAYLSEEELETAIEQLEIVLEFDPENADRAARLAKLAQIAGDFDKAEEVLTPFADARKPEATPQPILRELGITLCRKSPQGSEPYALGQKFLELASHGRFRDVDAICSLAGSWKKMDEAKVRELYQKAFETDPYNTYALGSYLEHELPHSPGILPATRPLIEKAIERCQAHATARVNLPWAYYDMGKFHLLLDEPFESLSAYAKALSVSTASFMVETSLASIERLEPVGDHFRGYEWVRRLLLLGLAARFPSTENREAVKELSTSGADQIEGPVLIVAGGTDPRVEEQMRSYSKLLKQALSGFEGTVISGGTKEGVSGLVGDAARAYPKRVHSIGYLPDLLPKDATPDKNKGRYREIRHTDGQGFTPLEPLQNWIDIFSSGLPPDRVRVLGINGGAIAGAEYQMALALGAKVGLISDSGREAGRLVKDQAWSGFKNLLDLPADQGTIQAFVTWEPPVLKGFNTEKVARVIHEEYRKERRANPPAGDPSLKAWKSLRPDLKFSNLDQARHMSVKLRAIGCECVDAGDAPEAPIQLTDKEVEKLAQMEHGRWVVERLAKGWQIGEERDPEKKTNPHLVGWSELPEEIRELDRQTVRKIPQFLETAGKQVRRIG